MPDCELTPIRVRGKRYRNKNAMLKGRTQANDARLCCEPSTKPIKRKFWEDTPSRYDKTVKSVKAEGPKICHLEALPAELIEKIFLDSLELNLARASPHFGAILSRKRIYKVLTFLAFFNDPKPEDKTGSDYISDIIRPLTYGPLNISEQKSLQNEVLSCRWFNLSLFKECQRDMFSAVLQKFFFGLEPCGSEMVLDPQWRDALNCDLNEDPLHWNISLQATDRRNEPGRLHISCITVTVTSESTGALQFLPVAVRAIPDKFFAEQPWTEEKFRLLHYLLLFTPYGFMQNAPKYMYTFPPVLDISRERIQDCIHHAIMQKNIWSLSELLAWDERAHRNVSKIYPSGYGIRGEYFVTAVKQSDDPGLLQVLLRAHAESIPYDDPDITAWALRQKNREFGQWLLSYMIEVPARRRDGRLLFSGGWALRHDRRDGHDFPDDADCYVWWAHFEKYVKDRLPAGGIG
ncbi:hypothetical protein AJ78_02773 [Emergomyces pasteurianus Ep9510]|uniref:Uncharacterized protein n=1 Tax=Emergomyces pasteurianus Ep9510 TaxID=1447872 RepID=A0A1J9PKU2_9EURO|nr:hypothetical protein AJ78_02773 [Emergomyces pasteurianus Ep9510]